MECPNIDLTLQWCKAWDPNALC